MYQSLIPAGVLSSLLEVPVCGMWSSISPVLWEQSLSVWHSVFITLFMPL